ncbi:MAG TPA: acyl-CoA dehydrogenase family protein [Polyangiaceae bacterium]|jgi:alkylation response protein AidB-like acyl-CoA dehydrogenase|nr:acyl-CoA dehydrogenase family protein [Polyangiaceae bacterium]
MDFSENPDHALLLESVRRIGERYGHKYYQEQSQNGGRATELWNELGENGFLGVNIPEQYGGGGLGITELMLVSEELASMGCPLLLMLVSPAICATILAKHGTEAQKERFLPGLAQGKKMAFAITEPNAGSNSHDIDTRARKEGNKYCLNGTKYYISGFDEADHVLVVTRTGTDEDTGKGELSLFVVDAKAPGLTAQHIPVEIKAPEKQYTLFFENVWVDEDRLLGEAGNGLRQVFVGLQPERILGASISNGLGRYALGKASQYGRERIVWDAPIGAHQGIAHPLAQAKIDLELARLMTVKAAWQYDHGVNAAEAANMAKYAAAEAGLSALDAAIQTHGGNGLASEYGLADLWGMARLLRTAPVSREMILNYIAQHSLKLPRSY